MKIEIVIHDELKEKAIQAIVSAARTGRIGDGKIFISRLDEAIRIRTTSAAKTHCKLGEMRASMLLFPEHRVL